MATDKTTPGTGTPEEIQSKELTIPGVTALRDRYLVTRGLEDSGYFHIGSRDGKSFAQFSITPEGDAWTLAVVNPGLEGPTRHELGVIPNKDSGMLEPYVFTRIAEKTTLGSDLFEAYLDKKYPEPELEGTPDGHMPNRKLIGITTDGIGILAEPVQSLDDADGIATARAGIKA